MGEPPSREPPPSYHTILEAAVAEFVERGRDGVRMERVAKRAGLNKSLVYRHFGNRDRLYEAALESVFEERFGLLTDLPGDLGELFDVWSDRFSTDKTFLTMLLREAIESSRDEPVHSDLRRRYYERQCEAIRGMQADGRLSPAVASEHLFLMLMAVLVFPHALPQVAFLVTGQRTDSEPFRQAWREAFGVLVRQLSSKERGISRVDSPDHPE